MSPRYRSLSGTIVDPEKRPFSHDAYHHPSDSDSDEAPMLTTSSRSTSAGSHDPMLTRDGRGPRPPTFAYHLPRRRFTRYFTLILSATLGLFILYLFSASRISDARLQAAAAAQAAVDGGDTSVVSPDTLPHRPQEPRPWENFPFLKRYHGGIRTLVPRDEDHVPEYPVDAETEVQRLKEAMGEDIEVEEKGYGRRKAMKRRGLDGFPTGERFNPYPSYAEGGEYAAFEPPVTCYLSNETRAEVPRLLAYPGVTRGFPDPVMGSYEIFGLRNDVCFERYGRLGPYGYGYSRKFGGSGAGMEGEKEGSEQVWGGEPEVDYREVSWGRAQERCMQANAHRFKPLASGDHSTFMNFMGSATPRAEASEQPEVDVRSTTGPNGKQPLNRTAVVIRTWSNYVYDDEDMFYLRSLVNELSLQSGGEYTIHFLIQVKNDNLQIWADETIYQQVLDEALPAEFRGLGTLWSERQMGVIYSAVDDNNFRHLSVTGVYRSTYMPMQYFAHMHPEYDFFWHWEMDVRYTGHFYHLFNKVSQWAKRQPRKGLWERNSRFYVPAEHGSWEDFRHMVRVQTEHGTAHQQSIYSKISADAGKKNPLDNERPETPVWGPMPPTGQNDSTVDSESDPQPPTTFEKDKYVWGVGEEADFITFNPLFDPDNTNWLLAKDVTGYNVSDGLPPRRAAIITASRLSRRLLETMHRETALKQHTMFSEMWPGSCALQHGYKAVYAPHPVYIDRAWPTSYLAAIFNNGRNGAAGGARTSVFGDERQHNFLGVSWYYHSGFAPNLWRRWMGFKVDNDGGEQWELANEGRMCMPAMLLHPVKQVDLQYERYEDETPAVD